MQKLETHRWTREAYDRMIEAGVLGSNDRVELIDGEIVCVSPQGSRHATAIQLAQEALQGAFEAGFIVRNQLPLALDACSEPEPDLAVVRGEPRDYLAAHPAPEATILVVEVSDDSLERDRSTKGSLYARAGIPEFWIVNLIDRQIEVFRNPLPSNESYFGFAYGEVHVFTYGSYISAVAAPSNPVLADDLLP
jgi:Uma2 family endonuclease